MFVLFIVSIYYFVKCFVNMFIIYVLFLDKFEVGNKCWINWKSICYVLVLNFYEIIF